MNLLPGMKTYIVCAIAIIYALSSFLTGHIDANNLVELILAALGAAGLRSGMNTENKK